MKKSSFGKALSKVEQKFIVGGQSKQCECECNEESPFGPYCGHLGMLTQCCDG